MVSPVPKAAAMINVEIMMPTMMRMVCARRLGMLRSPSFSITGLRQPMTAITTNAGRNTASRPYIMESIGTPKSSSIAVLVFFRLEGGLPRVPLAVGEAVVDDFAVAHADNAVGAVAHLDGVGH